MAFDGRGSNYYLKTVASEIGNTINKAASNRGKGWYTPFMIAASRAIAARIPLVDFILEVRDARVCAPFGLPHSFIYPIATCLMELSPTLFFNAYRFLCLQHVSY